MTNVKIVNVVATASLGQDVDFEELRKSEEIFHDSDVYGGRVAYLKVIGMQGRVSIFLSGKMISAGTKSETQAFKELEQAMRFLVEKGQIETVNLQPKTQNIVVTVDFESSLNLKKISENLKAIYEPEKFPGAILRLKEPFKASILVFASGKTVIAGLKNSKQIEPTVQLLKQLIESNQ